MNNPLPANDAISVGVSYDCWWQMHDSVFAECDDADLWLCGHNSHELCDWPVHIELVKEWDVKTESPKWVVTIVHFTTISGHFLANPFNIFHTNEALLIQNDQ